MATYPHIVGEQERPTSVHAEMTILGAMLVEPVAIIDATMLLKTDDFALDSHRKIYDAMLHLVEVGYAVDIVTVTDYLSKKKELDSVGGLPYLASLSEGLPRKLSIESYVRIVRDKSLMRQLLTVCDMGMIEASDQSREALDVLNQVTGRLTEISEHAVTGGFSDIAAIVKDSFGSIDALYEQGREVTGLATHYIEFDRMTSGLQESELIIIAARPSMGKTALALNIAENVVLRSGEPVAIFSLEMSKESLLLRLLSSQARIDAHKFRTGNLGHEDWSKITNGLATLGEAPLWIDDSASSSVLEMSAKARRLKKDKGLSLVIVDYLQLIVAHGRFGNRNEEVSYISRALKGMAKELQVPVVVLSQLTRGPEREEREPRLSDLRESGAIEQDADVVLFINRPNFYKTDLPEEDRAKADVTIAKQRNGPTGNLKFVFIARHTRFEEAAPDAWSAGGEPEE